MEWYKGEGMGGWEVQNLNVQTDLNPNLPFETGEPKLKTLLSNAGDVMSVNIVKDRQTGQPRGFAFVEMFTQLEARKAVSMLNRRNFMGKDLLVKEARENRGFRGR